MLTTELLAVEEKGSGFLAVAASWLDRTIQFFKPMRRHEMYAAVKDAPVFQLSNYAEYTEAVMEKFELMFASAAAKFQARSEQIAMRVCHDDCIGTDALKIIIPVTDNHHPDHRIYADGGSVVNDTTVEYGRVLFLNP